MSKLRAISFDLTGTLLAFTPSLGTICAETMREIGMPESEIPPAKTFDARRKQAQRVIRANGFSTTSEARSRDYWRAMLWEIYAGTVPDALFPRAAERIYARLGEARSWRAAPAAVAALDAARFLGLKCVALSNGDARWRRALEAVGLARFFDKIFLSAETGLAKPDPKAFDRVCLDLQIRRDELIHVGDALDTDVLPAQKLGISAVWLMNSIDDSPRKPDGIVAIESLAELPELLRARLCAGTVRKHFSRSARNLLALLRGVPEEPPPPPSLIVSKKFSSESATQKRVRSEEAPSAADTEFVVPADIVDALVRSRGFFNGSMQERIRENWAQIVPDGLAERCSPTELRANFTTLVIACESAVVRQNLEFKKRTLLKRLRALPGCEKLKKITFTNELC